MRPFTFTSKIFCNHKDGTFSGWYEYEIRINSDRSFTVLSKKAITPPEEQNKYIDRMSNNSSEYINKYGGDEWWN